jgi:hypothetical protein
MTVREDSGTTLKFHLAALYAAPTGTRHCPWIRKIGRTGGTRGRLRYCWTKSTIGMMVGGCASSMPSSSITGPRYVRNSSNAS